MSFKLKTLLVCALAAVAIIISLHTVAQTGGATLPENDLENLLPKRLCCPIGTTAPYARHKKLGHERVCCKAGSAIELTRDEVDEWCCADAGGEYFEADGVRVCCKAGSSKSIETGLVDPICCAKRGGKIGASGQCCRCKTPDCPTKPLEPAH